MDLLEKHWPTIRTAPSPISVEHSVSDDLSQHAVRNDDWTSTEILDRCGFFESSQARVFQFLEDIVHPIRRDQEEQERIVAKLNPILRKDAYRFIPSGRISGYPVYKISEVIASGSQPADELISKALSSFDENAVHHGWTKALERRLTDPEGAITSAKTLLESICKHIIDEAGGSYGDNDDLPKLYNSTAELLNLAPSQHTEIAFKSILGNCQAVVGNLAGLRNKLGDSHGQGKLYVKPQARHAELAVNLAGTMALFLVSTWTARKEKNASNTAAS